MSASAPSFLVLGRLRREFIITSAGKILLDQPGGNALYAAGGVALWGEQPGILARVGEDYPRAWLDEMAKVGVNTQGIRVLPEAHDLRSFIAYTDLRTRITADPMAHYARLQQSFPKALLGYKDPDQPAADLNTLSPLSLRQSDLPEDYTYASAAHLCPQDYLAHSLMPAALREAGVKAITLDPGPQYMKPEFRHSISPLLQGILAFMPTEGELRELFKGVTQDVWQMAEVLAGYRCDLIVIKRGSHGQWLYDAASKTRYEIPAYPAEVNDLTGAGDAFCGGFLVGYRRTFDPLQAVLYGNVAASIAVENSGAFYAWKSLPGLAQARLDTLKPLVRKV